MPFFRKTGLAAFACIKPLTVVPVSHSRIVSHHIIPRGSCCLLGFNTLNLQGLIATSSQENPVKSLISNSHGNFFRNYHDLKSPGSETAHAYVFEDIRADITDSLEYHIYASLQGRYLDYTVTTVDSTADLLQFARAGEARASLDTEGQKLLSWLKYEPTKQDSPAKDSGKLKDKVQFARYYYQWRDESFIVYLYCGCPNHDPPSDITYFILRKREGDRIVDGRSSIVRDLVAAASTHANEVHEGDVLVWDDDSWTKSTQLWKSVQKSKWDNVILDSTLKSSLIKDVEGFFDQKDDYNQFEVPWKRGIIIHGLPGNGKTMTIKALMNGLATRLRPIPTLYVKSGKGVYGTIYAIRHIFKKARQMAPCLLVFEDLDSLITEESRSFFLNEVDGMESNDGIMMIGSTNYLEKLDAGLTKRPSRFDRKYHFDLPALTERTRYCDFWRSRLANKKAIEFLAKLSSAIAGITEGFSFAYLQEAFISSLLTIVSEQRKNPDEKSLGTADNNVGNLDSVLLWRVMCKQVEMLRNEIKGSRKSVKDAMEYIGPKQTSKAGFA